MNPFVMGAMLVLALSAFAYTMQHRVRLLLALRGENRFDHPVARLGAMLKFAVGQRRMVQRPDTRPGTAHVLIFFGFLVVSLRTIPLVGQVFSTGFQVPSTSSTQMPKWCRPTKSLPLPCAERSSLKCSSAVLMTPSDRNTPSARLESVSPITSKPKICL